MNVECPVGGEGLPGSVSLPTSVTDKRTPVQWGPTNIDTVEVCMVVIDDNFLKCGRSDESNIELQIFHPSTSQPIAIRRRFNPDFVVSQKYCYAFDACDTADLLKGRNITGTELTASARLVAYQKLATPTKFRVSLRSASYTFPHEGIISTIPDHRVHSLICTVPKCSVSSKSPYIGTIKTSRFKVMRNQAPRCQRGVDQITDGMFSVTSYKCDNCPKQFVATTSKSSKKLNLVTILSFNLC